MPGKKNEVNVTQCRKIDFHGAAASSVGSWRYTSQSDISHEEHGYEDANCSSVGDTAFSRQFPPGPLLPSSPW